MPEAPSSAPEEKPELMTAQETAEYLRIPLPTVYYYLKEGTLPWVLIGGRWRIKKSIIDKAVLNPPSIVLKFGDEELWERVRKILVRKWGKRNIALATTIDENDPNQTVITDWLVADLVSKNYSGRVFSIIVKSTTGSAKMTADINSGITPTFISEEHVEDNEKWLRNIFKLDEPLTSR